MDQKINESNVDQQQKQKIDIDKAEGVVLGSYFLIKQRLKSGVFGVVYKIHDQRNQNEYALKFEKLEVKHRAQQNEQVSYLKKEIQMLTELQGIEGIPQIISYGRKQNHIFLIQTLYDCDLTEKMKRSNLKILSANSALELARQLLLILERVHEKGYVHRDLKPDNIMVGRSIRVPQYIQQNSNQINRQDISLSLQNQLSHPNLKSFSDISCFQSKMNYLSAIEVESKQRLTGRGKTQTVEHLHTQQKVDTFKTEKDLIEEMCYRQRLSALNIRKDENRKFTVSNNQEQKEPTSIKLLNISQASIANQLLSTNQIQNSIIDQNIYLIDFGISKKIISSSGQHITMSGNKQFVGTLRFASLAAHKGIEIGRKDDLESLGYIVIFLMKGKLPWQGLQMNNELQKDQLKEELFRIKNEIPLAELCSGLPLGVFEYMKYVKSLKFSDLPSYDKCWKLLKTSYNTVTSSYDQFIFHGWDWDQKSANNNQQDVNTRHLLSQKIEQISNNNGVQKNQPLNQMKVLRFHTIQTNEEDQEEQYFQDKEYQNISKSQNKLEIINTNKAIHYENSKNDDEGEGGESIIFNRSSFLSLLKSSSYENQLINENNQKKTFQKVFMGNSPRDYSPLYTQTRYTQQNQGSSFHYYHLNLQNSPSINYNLNEQQSQNSLDYDSQDGEYYNDKELILKIQTVNANPVPRFFEEMDIAI